MGKLSTFTFISLDGYFKGSNGGTDWHHHDREDEQYSEESLQSGSILLFGRTTYEMMAAFWPSPEAKAMFPIVAEGMNSAKKLVISSTLKSPEWRNTEVLNKNWIDKIGSLKKESDITLLGSGSILTQLVDANLVDQFQLMIDPVVLGNGTSIFKGISSQLDLQLTSSKTFKNGKLLLNYESVR